MLERVVVVGGGPLAPAVGKAQGGGKGLPHSFEFVLFAGFEFVENAKKEDPGEFGDVLKGTGTVGAAHDVADGFDVAIEALLGGEDATVTVGRTHAVINTVENYRKRGILVIQSALGFQPHGVGKLPLSARFVEFFHL